MYTVQSSTIGCITHILIGNECFNPKYRDLTFWRRHMKYAVFKCSRIIIQLKSNLIWKRSNYASRLLLARIFLCCYVNHNFLCCYNCDQSACRLWFSEKGIHIVDTLGGSFCTIEVKLANYLPTIFHWLLSADSEEDIWNMRYLKTKLYN